MARFLWNGTPRVKLILFTLLYSSCKVKTGPSQNDVIGNDTLKLTRSVGSGSFSTDTFCLEMETQRLFGNLSLGLKCFRLVNLSDLRPHLSLYYQQNHTVPG